ncbi:chaplin [Streptomyces sp. HB2AG]|uniref:chaplin n=1 Tax=Streptomyces sp. HB2AG TaxID=2983400 RepID=UPI002E7B60DC|nr:chaplin [Streptomyces sp. HB2AG]
MRQVARKRLLTVVAASGVIAAGAGYAHADSGAQGVAAGSPGVLSGNTVQAPVNVPVNVCDTTVTGAGVLNQSIGDTACINADGADKDDAKSYGSKVEGHKGGDRKEDSRDWKGSSDKDRGDHHGEKRAGGVHGDDDSEHAGGANAEAAAVGSPGVLSGNVVQAPVNAPVNVCDTNVDVVALLNLDKGNTACVNESGGHGRDKDRDHGRDHGRDHDHGRDKDKDKDRDHGRDHGRDHDRDHDRDHEGRDEGYEGDHGYEGEHGKRPAGERGVLAETGASGPANMLAPAAAGLILGGAVLYRRSRASRV